MDNLLGGDWGEMQITNYALEIKLVFGCFYVFDIANTEIQTSKEYIKYQGRR